jgi:hypothetical protein
MDWVARLLALHPQIALVDAKDELGPLGCLGWISNRQRPSGEVAARIAAAVAQKPAVTRVGVVGVEGAMDDIPGTRIEVLRDGRDVMVHWTLRQLRHHGPVLQRFLAEGGDTRMPEVARRFAADAADVLERNRGLLLCDYQWVRYGGHLWEDKVTGLAEALAWSYDHPDGGVDPFVVRFHEARAAPRDTFDYLVGRLGLDPTQVPPFAVKDPVHAAERDAERLGEWEAAVWPRWFTARATKLWKMDAQRGLDSLAGHTVDDEWQGECPPA